MAILNAIAEELNRAADVRRALERTLAQVSELLGVRSGWVWLLDPETQQFYLAASLNLPPYLRQPVRMTGSYCTCIEEFRSGGLTPRNIDVIECSRLQPAVARKAITLTQGLRYHASIPLYAHDEPVGIMNLTGPAWRQLSPDQLRLLTTIGYSVGVTVERARLAAEGARLARAEERARIARDIHDTLAQSLTAIGLQVEAALRHLPRGNTEARTRLGRVLVVARDGLHEARRSVLGLRRSPLDGKPLGHGLAALARSFTSDTGIRVELKVDAELSLPAAVEAELYRIAQEALTNVRKHARATSVRLGLRANRRRAILIISDDGKGLSLHGASRRGGQGIVGMRERAQLIGGSLRINASAGTGTRITVRVPVEEE